MKPNDSAFGLVLKVLISSEGFVVVETADGDKRTFRVDEVEWCEEAPILDGHLSKFSEGDTRPDVSPFTPPALECEIPNEFFDEGGKTIVQAFVLRS